MQPQSFLHMSTLQMLARHIPGKITKSRLGPNNMGLFSYKRTIKRSERKVKCYFLQLNGIKRIILFNILEELINNDNNIIILRLSVNQQQQQQQPLSPVS